MALHKVVKYPNPVLTTPTLPVTSIGPKEIELVRDMIETMHEENGVGLAANQIGIPLQIFVASADGVEGRELAFFNPRLIDKKGKIREFEGCLSVNEIYEPVTRYRKVTLEAMNIEGKTVRVKADGLLSRIFQHEIDHLNGKIFVHRLSWLKRGRLLSKLEKKKKS